MNTRFYFIFSHFIAHIDIYIRTVYICSHSMVRSNDKRNRGLFSKRTNIHLSPHQRKWLSEQAIKLEISASEVLRRLVDEVIKYNPSILEEKNRKISSIIEPALNKTAFVVPLPNEERPTYVKWEED
jgi:hypothetical protein